MPPLIRFIDLDIVVMVLQEIVNSYAQNVAQIRVKIPRLLKQTTFLSQNIPMWGAVGRIVASHVDFAVLSNQHESDDERHHPASDHDKLDRDIGAIGKPDPVFFGGQRLVSGWRVCSPISAGR